MMRATMQAKEAAAFLGMSYWKLLELKKAGKVPHVPIGGRVLFRKESLERWLQEREAASIRLEPEADAEKIRRLK